MKSSSWRKMEAVNVVAILPCARVFMPASYTALFASFTIIRSRSAAGVSTGAFLSAVSAECTANWLASSPRPVPPTPSAITAAIPSDRTISGLDGCQNPSVSSFRLRTGPAMDICAYVNSMRYSGLRVASRASVSLWDGFRNVKPAAPLLEQPVRESLFKCRSTHSRGLRREDHGLALGLAVHRQVDGSDHNPEQGDSKRDVRFAPAHAGHAERRNRSQQIEQHATEVGQKPEHRNEHVLEPVK